MQRAVLVGPLVELNKKWKKVFEDSSLDPNTDCLVGVDAGSWIWKQMGTIPDLAVGDWDSLEEWHGKKKAEAFLKKVPHLTLAKEKNRSDLFYAVRSVISLKFDSLVCIGMTGGRADHHLAALQDLSQISEGRYGKVQELMAWDDKDRYYFISQATLPWTQKIKKGKRVSVFPMSGKASGVTIQGLKYDLANATLIPSSHGLSNLGLGEEVQISVRQGTLVIIVPTDEYHDE